jgi:hypothetical protein
MTNPVRAPAFFPQGVLTITQEDKDIPRARIACCTLLSFSQRTVTITLPRGIINKALTPYSVSIDASFFFDNSYAPFSGTSWTFVTGDVQDLDIIAPSRNAFLIPSSSFASLNRCCFDVSFAEPVLLSLSLATSYSSLPIASSSAFTTLQAQLVSAVLTALDVAADRVSLDEITPGPNQNTIIVTYRFNPASVYERHLLASPTSLASQLESLISLNTSIWFLQPAPAMLTTVSPQASSTLEPPGSFRSLS